MNSESESLQPPFYVKPTPQKMTSRIKKRHTACHPCKTVTICKPTTPEPIHNLTLYEEVFLLGLKEGGYTSFWNDCISAGLRGCILAELALNGHIALEPSSGTKSNIFKRRLIVTSSENPSDNILATTLKCIKSSNSLETVGTWIMYLTGESWNPLKQKFHLKNVRETIAKNLVEKGVLTTDKLNFLFFDVVTHPILNERSRADIGRKIQRALLEDWQSCAHNMNPRTLALIVLGNYSDVLENALYDLDEEDYDIAKRRIKKLFMSNFDLNDFQDCHHEVLKAIFLYLSQSC